MFCSFNGTIQWMHMVSHYKYIWWPFTNTRRMCFRGRSCCLTMHWQLLDTSMPWTITRDVPLLFIILQVWTFMLHYSLYIIDYTVSCINFVGRILVSINNYTMTWSSINLYPILRILVCFRWPKKKCEVPGFYPLESLVLWPRVSGKKKFLKSEL